jgi:hypothetical protein
VAQTVYDHPEFAFLSLHYLTQLLGALGLRPGGRPHCLGKPAAHSYANPGLRGKPLPACVTLHHGDDKRVTYLHPATGWVEKTVATFAECWAGMVVLVSLPEGEEMLPWGITSSHYARAQWDTRNCTYPWRKRWSIWTGSWCCTTPNAGLALFKEIPDVGRFY